MNKKLIAAGSIVIFIALGILLTNSENSDSIDKQIKEQVSVSKAPSKETQITIEDITHSNGELDVQKVMKLTRDDISKIPGFELLEKYGRSSDDYQITLPTGTQYIVSFVIDKENPTLFDIYGYDKNNYCIDSDGEGFLKELNVSFSSKIEWESTCNETQGKKYPFVHLLIKN